MHFSTTLLATLVATASAARNKRSFAVLQHVGDGPLMNCRADPIVSPGAPSAHVHTFFGGNNIGLNTTGEDLRQSSCTTALPKADHSAYWFPRLYFKDPGTGKLEPVPFYYMNVYYFFDATNDDIKSFPVGLQLVSGNAKLRTPPAKTSISNLDPSKGPLSPAQITCPRSNFNPPSWPAGSDGSSAGIGEPNNQGVGIGFPLQDCDGQYSPMRVDVHFPSCYNPAAGLTAHGSNSAFPSDAGGGKLDCPKGWTHVPHMFYESYWNTHAFADRFKGLVGKESPFVFSNGDTTGYSAHADFISGWDERALQQIVDNCDVGHQGIHNCPGLIGGVNDRSQRCKATCPVNENVDGPFDQLPGNNPLSGYKYGSGGGSTNPPSNPPSNPGPVDPPAQPPVSVSVDVPAYPVPTTLVPTIKEVSVQPPAATPKPEPEVDGGDAKTTTVWNTVTEWQTKTVIAGGPAPTKGADGPSVKDVGEYKYVGCYKDASDRVLTGIKFVNLGKVNNTGCVDHCSSKGFSIAGTEYGGECFCGNGLAKVEKIDESKCKMACNGAPNEICGGSWALSLYSKGGAEPAVVSRRLVSRRHAHEHLMHHRRGHSHNH